MKSETSLQMNWNNNILILGDGYMGNHLYNHLSQFFKVDKKSRKQLDYHDPNTLYKYLLNNDVKVVINCSGFTGTPNIDEAELKKDLCWELNVDVPKLINNICDKAGINYLHVSSGCIYDGYHKDWTEEDAPNFGMFNNKASFYSKCKHAFELTTKDLKGKILRIRMPLGPDSSRRNYLSKIRNYNNLIDFKNSKTYIPDFCEFVKELLIKEDGFWTCREIYNVVNPDPLTTKQVCDIMTEYGYQNNHWKFVDISELDIISSRSNCVLDCSKVMEIYKMKTEEETLREIFSNERYNTQ